MLKIKTSFLFVGLFASLLSVSVFAADRIEKVKYLGKVNLDEFQCRDAKDKAIPELCYLKKTRTMVAKVNGKYIGYCGAPKSVYSSWLKSTHKKTYFEHKVKGKYACSK